MLAVICLAMLLPLPLRDTHGDFADFVANGVSELLSIGWTQVGDLVVPFANRLFLISLVWLLPNWLYWKKRQWLFS